MNEIEIQRQMFQKAIDFIEQRFPNCRGKVAVAYTSDSRFLTSVAIDTINCNVDLCVETGVICEAAKYNLKITHCICVVRDTPCGNYMVLSPCGICQERLRYYGIDTKVGVTTKDNSLKFVPLSELQLYHWTTAFSDIEFYDNRQIK